uniref:FAR1 domain-containing protein n=1 Tax=Lactuca sativa TaxID=4236 RepID=A0A9R1VTN1_LACSA|nr:hypothetical protein LSAT_V11C400160170 [Lactuca sativa]
MCESEPASFHSDGVQRLQVVEKTWTPKTGLKPFVVKLFPLYDDALSFYREYARKSGFEMRKVTTEQSKTGDGYSHRRKQRRNWPSHRKGCKACIRLKLNDENIWVVRHFEEKQTHELVNLEDFHFLKSNRRLKLISSKATDS